MGECPEILPLIEVLMSLYESSEEEQNNMVEGLVRVARESVAQLKAVSLSELLNSNLDEMITREVAKIDSVFAMQVHKETLIREACSYITYQNHGVEEEECKILLSNPSLDVGPLISYDYDKDMCSCLTCEPFDKILSIPAAINDGISNTFFVSNYLFLL